MFELFRNMEDGRENHLGDKKRGPPIKVLSSQLREGKEGSVSRGKIEYIIKRMGHTKSIPLKVSMVWMQGTVLKVDLENSVLLLDETGTFVVNGISNIPKGESLCEGKYVMVMGVIQALSPEPVLRAVKIANLSGRAEIHRRMWKLEVEDLQNILGPTQ